jgi:hypothetical protein
MCLIQTYDELHDDPAHSGTGEYGVRPINEIEGVPSIEIRNGGRKNTKWKQERKTMGGRSIHSICRSEPDTL